MATIDELVTGGYLKPIHIRLGPKEFEDRKMYASPLFWNWLHGPVMSAESFYSENAKPRYQARDLLKTYLSGKPFGSGRMFKRMRPASNDVFELRSPDLRFFGWFVRKDVFIAVIGDLFENLKADESLYEKHRIDCMNFRDQIDLDEPKYTPGAGEQDVISC